MFITGSPETTQLELAYGFEHVLVGWQMTEMFCFQNLNQGLSIYVCMMRIITNITEKQTSLLLCILYLYNFSYKNVS